MSKTALEIDNAERLMTFSTSAVAVCCCSASVRSRVRACTSSNSRTFSIAITAGSAKVCKKLDLSLVERSGHEATYQQRALDPVGTQQRHADDGTYARQRIHRRLEFAVGEGVAEPFSGLAGKHRLARTTEAILLGVAGCSERYRQIAEFLTFGHRPVIPEHIAIANTDRPGPAADQRKTAEAIKRLETPRLRSNAERLMVFSTSAVAVCCRSASWVSLKRLTLLIAIAA